MIINALIVDDEPDAVDMLTAMAQYTSFELEFNACFTDPREALKYEQWDDIDLLFLDVQMPFISGIDLLQQLGAIKAKTIFTTAYDAYALQALKLGACDYLLKPVTLTELTEALKKATADLITPPKEEGIMKGHICVPTSHGFRILDLKDIIFLEASGNYTYIQLASEQKPLIVSRTLKVFDDYFTNSFLVRISQSSIINLYYLKTFERNSGGVATLANGKQLTVSSKYKPIFLKCLESIRV